MKGVYLRLDLDRCFWAYTFTWTAAFGRKAAAAFGPTPLPGPLLLGERRRLRSSVGRRLLLGERRRE